MDRSPVVRFLLTLGGALVVAGWLYFAHPTWFANHSAYVMPVAAVQPTTGPTPIPRPTPTPAMPHVGQEQHLDNIWVTPLRVNHSQGANGILPNLDDEFLVVYLRLRNLSANDFPVRAGDFFVLDSHGEIDPPLDHDFTRTRLREVRLIPHGYTIGTLVFEAPVHDLAATLVYQPDILDPTKHLEWLIR